MKLFHRTTSANAKRILACGFRDKTGSYMMANTQVTGVWVSDRVLDANEGASGNSILQIEVTMTRKQLAFYEIVETGKPYREWCIPARLLNKGSIREEA